MESRWRYHPHAQQIELVRPKKVYNQKNRWKGFLLLGAVLIGGATLWYTQQVVRELRDVERRKVMVWAEATRQINFFSNDDQAIGFVFEVIRENKTVPVILTDENGGIKGYRNLDSARALEPGFLEEQLQIMKQDHEPIVIDYLGGGKDIVYYRDSTLLTKLQYFPVVMLLVIALFIGVAYLAFDTARRSEQNQVWAGMARETAHQIGTPLTSLTGWIEVLRNARVAPEMLSEMQRDVNRLNTIADRFSKIGSRPILRDTNLNQLLEGVIGYLRPRIRQSIQLELIAPEEPINLPLNAALFEWVVENLVVNAIDAMGDVSEGSITINLSKTGPHAVLDVTDTGKGMKRSDYKTVFKPGYTTKQRGWGLGLSLAKRIVEEYHNGKIVVHDSEIGRGTTFRVQIPHTS